MSKVFLHIQSTTVSVIVLLTNSVRNQTSKTISVCEMMRALAELSDVAVKDEQKETCDCRQI